MNSRERIRAIIAHGEPDRCGLWLGNPHADSKPALYRYFAVEGDEGLRLALKDDVRWIRPDKDDSFYRHPEGRPMFDFSPRRDSLGAPGWFAECTEVSEVDQFPWPDPAYLNFDATIEKLKTVGDFYRASGTWSPFFHIVAPLFGMENYFMRMYTHPQVVEAVTARVCEFYLEANERYFRAAGDMVDGFFFGNDFGSQADLLVSTDLFDRFIMPWFRKFTEQGHRHGHQVILHSCGAIHRVIDRLIDAGVDCLHPLQARACDMDADTLARDFKGRIAFMGAIDTQQLLVHGTPEEVKQDVYRVRRLLEPHLIVSPSHEAILPNVPPANIEALAEAALEPLPVAV